MKIISIDLILDLNFCHFVAEKSSAQAIFLRLNLIYEMEIKVILILRYFETQVNHLIHIIVAVSVFSLSLPLS